jgi:hypothetical protein
MVGQGRKPADWDSDAFQGIHDEFVLAIIDEANGVPKAMWTGVEGVTSNDTSKVLAIGNPDDPESEFARVSADKNTVWQKKKVSAFDTPNFTDEDVSPRLRRMLVGRNWVEARRLDWGEDSPLYVSRVLGEFPDLNTSKQKVIPASAVLACLEPPDEDKLSLLRRMPVELGMDVAASEDGDETVIRERRGAFVGRTWRGQTPDADQAIELALTAITESGATFIKVDEIGWGWGIVAAINRELKRNKSKCRAVGINVSRKAREATKFVNQRSELWWMLRDLCKDGAIVMYDMDDAESTMAQLTDPNWYEVAGGKIRVEEKDETRKRIGRSPDDADALILAFAKPTGVGGPATVSRAGSQTDGPVRSAATARRTSATTTPIRRRSGHLVARRG